MKDERNQEMVQESKAALENELKSENLDLSELEELEGGVDTGCTAMFSGGCSSGKPVQPQKMK